MNKEIYTPEEVEQLLKQCLVQEFLRDRSEVIIESDMLLIEEGIIDSLGIFVLINFIEEQFHVEVQQEEVVLHNFQTVNTIKSLIMSKLRSSEV